MQWKNFIEEEKKKSYFISLNNKITRRYEMSTIYPEKNNLFRSFKETPFESVKVVILGQDPYFNPGQAHGLSFSVPSTVPIPPSLHNIFQEVESSMGYQPIPSGDLTRWAQQGVLLLNSVLTVEAGQPASHKNIGWQLFTDNAIKFISDNTTGVVFLLWGAYAQSKSVLIDQKKHLVLHTSHPSPLSAHRGFLGCGHFYLTNIYLTLVHGSDIDWR